MQFWPIVLKVVLFGLMDVVVVVCSLAAGLGFERFLFEAVVAELVGIV